MESVYRWKGTIERQAEVLTDRQNRSVRSLTEFEREVRALHSYETPEIVALPITAGSRPTLNGSQASLDH